MLQYTQRFSTIEMILQHMLIVKILGSKNSVVCARAGGANTTPLFSAAYIAKKENCLEVPKSVSAM